MKVCDLEIGLFGGDGAGSQIGEGVVELVPGSVNGEERGEIGAEAELAGCKIDTAREGECGGVIGEFLAGEGGGNAGGEGAQGGNDSSECGGDA